MLKLRARQVFLKLIDLLIFSFKLHDFFETFIALAVKLILKLLFILDEGIDLLFFGKDFIWERKAVSFPGLAFWISIFDVMDNETAVLACSEQMMVIETHSHSFDWFGVSLDFVDFVDFAVAFGIFRDFVDHHWTWFVWITDSCK